MKINSKLLRIIEDTNIGINFSEKELKKANKYIQNNLSDYLIEFIKVTEYENLESKSVKEIKQGLVEKYPEAEVINEDVIERVLQNMKKVRICNNGENKYYIPKKRDYLIVIRSRNP